jgi:hypothetical protein
VFRRLLFSFPVFATILAVVLSANGPVTRLTSPDGRYILYRVDIPDQLRIEDTHTHHRQLLISVSSTLSASWSPDGLAFLVQDHWASDSARAFIYDAKTLQGLDLGSSILAADPGVRHFANGHAYFDVDRWEDTQHVFVRFHGHTDKFPVACFDFRYRVSRAGTVEKSSQRVFLIDDQTGCGG